MTASGRACECRLVLVRRGRHYVRSEYHRSRDRTRDILLVVTV